MAFVGGISPIGSFPKRTKDKEINVSHPSFRGIMNIER